MHCYLALLLDSPMRSVRTALGEVVTNLLPSTLGWKGLGNRNLDLLAPQPLQLTPKTGLLTLRRYSRFWDVLMNSRLGWQVTSWKEMLLIGGSLLNKTKQVRHMWLPCHRRISVTSSFCGTFSVDNAARNMEILRERSSQNNKINYDGDRIRPTAQGSIQRGQKGYSDYASSPPCDTCGTLHPGKACQNVTGACFTCGSTGHMARYYPKNCGNPGRGNGNDNQPAAKGRVFSSTKDQAANSSGTVSGTLFLNGDHL
ncbi:transposon ty3-I gag-pol polyprotein [Tanacetum coccineum]